MNARTFRGLLLTALWIYANWPRRSLLDSSTPTSETPSNNSQGSSKAVTAPTFPDGSKPPMTLDNWLQSATSGQKKNPGSTRPDIIVNPRTILADTDSDRLSDALEDVISGLLINGIKEEDLSYSISADMQSAWVYHQNELIYSVTLAPQSE